MALGKQKLSVLSRLNLTDKPSPHQAYSSRSGRFAKHWGTFYRATIEGCGQAFRSCFPRNGVIWFTNTDLDFNIPVTISFKQRNSGLAIAVTDKK